MRFAIIGILVAVKIFFGCPEWLAAGETSLLQKMLMYPLFHANWFHLAANSLAVYTIFRQPRYKQLILGYFISTLVYPIALTPVVGISNLLYAVLGLRTPAFNSKWWTMTPVIVFHVVTILMLFIPQFSAVTHIVSYLSGIAIAAAIRKIKEYGSVR